MTDRELITSGPAGAMLAAALEPLFGRDVIVCAG
jgi:hypothetical protein